MTRQVVDDGRAEGGTKTGRDLRDANLGWVATAAETAVWFLPGVWSGRASMGARPSVRAPAPKGGKAPKQPAPGSPDFVGPPVPARTPVWRPPRPSVKPPTAPGRRPAVAPPRSSNPSPGARAPAARPGVGGSAGAAIVAADAIPPDKLRGLPALNMNLIWPNGKRERPEDEPIVGWSEGLRGTEDPPMVPGYSDKEVFDALWNGTPLPPRIGPDHAGGPEDPAGPSGSADDQVDGGQDPSVWIAKNTPNLLITGGAILLAVVLFRR